jgi:hypothetical protein
VLNPGNDTFNWYGPTGKLGSTNVPSTELTADRTAPVSVFVIVTSAPGSAPPLASRTTPDTCELDTD